MAEINRDLALAKKILDRGDLVAIPTETVYGLAGNALNEQAILKIFATKNRPAFDPLIVHTHCMENVEALVRSIPVAARRLAEQIWPGPLTLLLPKKSQVPDLATSGLDTVAIRIPAHSLTLELLQSLEYPLAAPSANPFGYISPTTPEHVNQQLGDQIELILDGGESQIGIESTIIGFEGQQPIIYRLGGYALEDIERCVGPVSMLPHSTSNPQAPGMLKSHYAPRKPFFLRSRESLNKGYREGAVYLLFSEYLPDIDPSCQYLLSETGNMNEAAKALFSALRKLDQMPISQIFAEEVPNTGLGRAINDRLRRAAAV
ncbi:L-threonylcarbamoyladenylate synthase [Dyadobacter tibetensis]|uniref:L-threonylcarbamoyladenylate synthase n=1 Tax=Dyadobacter tibetensis TaxID=1211851 RepID=UPI00047223C0|nr:L-threonylcarbamoyladenylate synthase [Dyadobacter tibetensis]